MGRGESEWGREVRVRGGESEWGREGRGRKVRVRESVGGRVDVGGEWVWGESECGGE